MENSFLISPPKIDSAFHSSKSIKVLNNNANLSLREIISRKSVEENLKFLLDHKEVSEGEIESVLINSKGFGGNNATAAVLSPAVTRKMMLKKYGKSAFKKYRKQNQIVLENIQDYDRKMTEGSILPIYRFGDGVVDGEDLKITDDFISIPGSKSGVSLRIQNPFSDMTD